MDKESKRCLRVHGISFGLFLLFCLFVRLSVRLFVRLSVCLPVCLICYLPAYEQFERDTSIYFGWIYFLDRRGHYIAYLRLLCLCGDSAANGGGEGKGKGSGGSGIGQGLYFRPRLPSTESGNLRRRVP